MNKTNFVDYVKYDCAMTEAIAKYVINNVYGVNRKKHDEIKRVIFSDPATVVIWEDGTKTVVRCDSEAYDPEKGLAMALAKKFLGNKGNYYDTFKKWLPKNE